MTPTDVSSGLASFGVTRLAHFTPLKNLWHILEDGRIRSSQDLAARAPEMFSPTDRERFDGHPDHICCSFEYPNVYYLRKAQDKPAFRNYRDWACLLLEPTLAARPGTLFAPCNAAYGSGAHLQSGPAALTKCWDNPSMRGWSRGSGHHPAVPTDLQAEVLIPGPVVLSDVRGIVFADPETATEFHATYAQYGLRPDRVDWFVAPLLFDPDRLVTRLRQGGTIPETPWAPEPEGAA